MQPTPVVLSDFRPSRLPGCAAGFYCRPMKTFLCLLLVAAGWCVPGLRAQDPLTEERLDKLSGQIESLIEGQAAQNRRLTQLAADLQRLTERVNAANNGTASAEDLRRLAERVQEIDRKRESDREAILKQIEALAKIDRTPPPRTHQRTPPETPPTRPADEKGYEYTVQAGDTLSVIVEAYRQQGVKTSISEIQKANEGLNPNRLRPGQKIFIPAPKP